MPPPNGSRGRLDIDGIDALLRAEKLELFGGFTATPDDEVPPGTRTLLLIGPSEPGFWDHVTAAPEFADGGADPLDRWSARVLTRIAAEIGATALFPFGGPPYLPFIAWATRSGRAWTSPVGLLVQDRAGLMVSYRGALALPRDLPVAPAAARPCDTCDRPCLSACPVSALGPDGYDVAACKAFLDTEAGQECLTGGCLVRRACPVSRTYGRQPVQSAFHMRAFHR